MLGGKMMENFYEILGCLPDAKTEHLKQAYQKLALAHHPDKVQQNGVSSPETQASHITKFHAITKAWQVLSDPSLRSEYNARLKQQTLAQEWPIQDHVHLDDFDWDDENNTYLFSCRCGGTHELTRTDVWFGVDIVPCESCSLCVRVGYEGVDLADFEEQHEKT